MLWMLGLGAGALMLFFLLRRLLRRMTSFEAYRHKLEQTEARMQHELETDLRRMPVSETLAPVASGLRELLALHGTEVPCGIEAHPTHIEARLPSGVLIITYRIKPAGRERTGCYWEATTPDGTEHVCRDLDGLMRLAEEIFEADGCIKRMLI